MEVSKVFRENVKTCSIQISTNFQGVVREVSKAFPVSSFKRLSKKFQCC